MQNEPQMPLLTEQFLLDRLGPAPTVSRVANFLEEAASTTWRRIKDHQIQTLPGAGVTRINLKSLVAFLNGATDYKRTFKRGKKKGSRQSGAQSSRRVLAKQESAAHSANNL
jgi:hypothetical protein